MARTIPVGDTDSRQRSGRGWQIAWGVLLVITGVLAVLMPAIAALATVLVLGWVLILAGIFEIVHAFLTRAHGGFGWKLTSGILTLVLGLAILLIPAAAAASLGLLVGAFLVVAGIARCVLAFRLKPLRGWGWVLLDGVLSIILAVLMVIGWPYSSIAVIGLLAGISLISTGLWRIMLAPRAQG